MGPMRRWPRRWPAALVPRETASGRSSSATASPNEADFGAGRLLPQLRYRRCAAHSPREERPDRGTYPKADRPARVEQETAAGRVVLPNRRRRAILPCAESSGASDRLGPGAAGIPACTYSWKLLPSSTRRTGSLSRRPQVIDVRGADL